MSSGERNHREVVRHQFGIQAAGFELFQRDLPYLDAQDVVGWISGNLELHSDYSVLDVATGTGILARAISPHVQQVIGLDTTPEMLQAGKRQVEAQGLKNLIFEEGDAGELPYPNDSFHLVTNRIAMHHFQHPLGPAKEMFRVCRPGGHVATIDITSVQDCDLAAAHNRIERLRDPSHTRAMHVDELTKIAEATGLEIVRTSSANVELNADSWMDLTNTKPDTRVAIRQALEDELAGGASTGMRAFHKDGELMFSHTWLMLVGRKPAPPTGTAGDTRAAEQLP